MVQIRFLYHPMFRKWKKCFYGKLDSPASNTDLARPLADLNFSYSSPSRTVCTLVIMMKIMNDPLLSQYVFITLQSFLFQSSSTFLSIYLPNVYSLGFCITWFCYFLPFPALYPSLSHSFLTSFFLFSRFLSHFITFTAYLYPLAHPSSKINGPQPANAHTISFRLLI